MNITDTSNNSLVIDDDLNLTSDETDDTVLRNVFNSSAPNGYIDLQLFLSMAKENWPESNNLDEKKLEELVTLLDPFQNGFIDYKQFKYGINYLTKLLDSNNKTQNVSNKINENKTNKNPFLNDDLCSNGSSSNETFNEYDTSMDNEIQHSQQQHNQQHNQEQQQQQHENDLLIDFDDLFANNSKSNDNYETMLNTNNPFLDITNNTVEENYEDYGTLDTFKNDNIDKRNSYEQSNDYNSSCHHHHHQNYHRVLSRSASYIKSSILSKKRASESFLNNQNVVLDKDESDNIEQINLIHEYTKKNEKLIEEYEAKIRNYQIEIDQLKYEKHENEDKYLKLQNENSKLLEKIQELEEINQELEKNFKHTIDSERIRINDYINRLNITNSEEKDSLLTQIHKYEIDLNNYKDDISKYLRQITDLNRIIETKTANEYQLEEKLNYLKSDFTVLLRERDFYKEDNDSIKSKHNLRIEALTKELNDLRNSQQTKKRRSTTIGADDTKIKELENELKQINHEYKQAQLLIQDLNAQILRQSVDAGKLLLTQASAVQSLAAEMETLSKDELMDQLKYEQASNVRHREYIERILAAVMEKNPEILEIRQPQIKLTTGTRAKIISTNSVEFSK